MKDKQQKDSSKSDIKSNRAFQGNDSDPAKEKGKGEKVTKDDLKGKKVDADPEKQSDIPLERE